MDDSFNIVALGPYDHDQDGPAVIGDPDLGLCNYENLDQH